VSSSTSAARATMLRRRCAAAPLATTARPLAPVALHRTAPAAHRGWAFSCMMKGIMDYSISIVPANVPVRGNVLRFEHLRTHDL
jgi:hypothetical protein